MKAVQIDLNPNELTIDMPVDESNVKQKTESIEANGVIQPITVWANDLRIIDGFHRVEAAKRLEWKKIPCYIIDCPEVAFWDARIQSAKQHHAVSDARLFEWMYQSWRSNGWNSTARSWEEIKAEYERLGYKAPTLENPEAFAFGEWIYKHKPDSTQPENLQTPEQKWIAEKARKWGIDERLAWETIIERVLGKNFHASLPNAAVAQKHGKSLPQADVLSQEGIGADASNELANQWASHRRTGETRLPFSAYRTQNQNEKQEKKQKRPRKQVKPTPRTHHNRAKRVLDRALEDIQAEQDNLKGAPDGAALLAAHIEALGSMFVQLWPEIKQPDHNNPLALKNAALRKKIIEHAQRIASLERALGSKGYSEEMKNDVMAWSSVQIGE